VKTKNCRSYALAVVAAFSFPAAVTILFAQSQNLLVMLTGQTPNKQMKTKKPAEMKADTDGVHGFDFFMGSWRVHHRRLKERLANNHE